MLKVHSDKSIRDGNKGGTGTSPKVQVVRPHVVPGGRMFVGNRLKFLTIAKGEKNLANATLLNKELQSYVALWVNTNQRTDSVLRLTLKKFMFVHLFNSKVAQNTNIYLLDKNLKDALAGFLKISVNVLQNPAYGKNKEFNKALKDSISRLLWTFYSKYHFYAKPNFTRVEVWESIYTLLDLELPTCLPELFEDLLVSVKKLLPPKPVEPEVPYFIENLERLQAKRNFTEDCILVETPVVVDLCSSDSEDEPPGNETVSDKSKKGAEPTRQTILLSSDSEDEGAKRVSAIESNHQGRRRKKSVDEVNTGNIEEYVTRQAKLFMENIRKLTGRDDFTIKSVNGKLEVSLEPNSTTDLEISCSSNKHVASKPSDNPITPLPTVIERTSEDLIVDSPTDEPSKPFDNLLVDLATPVESPKNKTDEDILLADSDEDKVCSNEDLDEDFLLDDAEQMSEKSQGQKETEDTGHFLSLNSSQADETTYKSSLDDATLKEAVKGNGDQVIQDVRVNEGTFQESLKQDDRPEVQECTNTAVEQSIEEKNPIEPDNSLNVPLSQSEDLTNVPENLAPVDIKEPSKPEPCDDLEATIEKPSATTKEVFATAGVSKELEEVTQNLESKSTRFSATQDQPLCFEEHPVHDVSVCDKSETFEEIVEQRVSASSSLDTVNKTGSFDDATEVVSAEESASLEETSNKTQIAPEEMSPEINLIEDAKVTSQESLGPLVAQEEGKSELVEVENTSSAIDEPEQSQFQLPEVTFEEETQKNLEQLQTTSVEVALPPEVTPNQENLKNVELETSFQEDSYGGEGAIRSQEDSCGGEITSSTEEPIVATVPVEGALNQETVNNVEPEETFTTDTELLTAAAPPEVAPMEEASKNVEPIVNFSTDKAPVESVLPTLEVASEQKVSKNLEVEEPFAADQALYESTVPSTLPEVAPKQDALRNLKPVETSITEEALHEAKGLTPPPEVAFNQDTSKILESVETSTTDKVADKTPLEVALFATDQALNESTVPSTLPEVAPKQDALKPVETSITEEAPPPEVALNQETSKSSESVEISTTDKVADKTPLEVAPFATYQASNESTVPSTLPEVAPKQDVLKPVETSITEEPLHEEAPPPEVALNQETSKSSESVEISTTDKVADKTPLEVALFATDQASNESTVPSTLPEVAPKQDALKPVETSITEEALHEEAPPPEVAPNQETSKSSESVETSTSDEVTNKTPLEVAPEQEVVETSAGDKELNKCLEIATPPEVALEQTSLETSVTNKEAAVPSEDASNSLEPVETSITDEASNESIVPATPLDVTFEQEVSENLEPVETPITDEALDESTVPATPPEVSFIEDISKKLELVEISVTYKEILVEPVPLEGDLEPVKKSISDDSESTEVPEIIQESIKVDPITKTKLNLNKAVSSKEELDDRRENRSPPAVSKARNTGNKRKSNRRKRTVKPVKATQETPLPEAKKEEKPAPKEPDPNLIEKCKLIVQALNQIKPSEDLDVERAPVIGEQFKKDKTLKLEHFNLDGNKLVTDKSSTEIPKQESINIQGSEKETGAKTETTKEPVLPSKEPVTVKRQRNSNITILSNIVVKKTVPYSMNNQPIRKDDLLQLSGEAHVVHQPNLTNLAEDQTVAYKEGFDSFTQKQYLARETHQNKYTDPQKFIQKAKEAAFSDVTSLSFSCKEVVSSSTTVNDASTSEAASIIEDPVVCVAGNEEYRTPVEPVIEATQFVASNEEYPAVDETPVDALLAASISAVEEKPVPVETIISYSFIHQSVVEPAKIPFLEESHCADKLMTLAGVCSLQYSNDVHSSTTDATSNSPVHSDSSDSDSKLRIDEGWPREPEGNLKAKKEKSDVKIPRRYRTKAELKCMSLEDKITYSSEDDVPLTARIQKAIQNRELARKGRKPSGLATRKTPTITAPKRGRGGRQAARKTRSQSHKTLPEEPAQPSYTSKLRSRSKSTSDKDKSAIEELIIEDIEVESVVPKPTRRRGPKPKKNLNKEPPTAVVVRKQPEKVIEAAAPSATSSILLEPYLREEISLSPIPPPKKRYSKPNHPYLANNIARLQKILGTASKPADDVSPAEPDEEANILMIRQTADFISKNVSEVKTQEDGTPPPESRPQENQLVQNPLVSIAEVIEESAFSRTSEPRFDYSIASLLKEKVEVRRPSVDYSEQYPVAVYNDTMMKQDYYNSARPDERDFFGHEEEVATSATNFDQDKENKVYDYSMQKQEEVTENVGAPNSNCLVPFFDQTAPSVRDCGAMPLLRPPSSPEIPKKELKNLADKIVDKLLLGGNLSADGSMVAMLPGGSQTKVEVICDNLKTMKLAEKMKEEGDKRELRVDLPRSREGSVDSIKEAFGLELKSKARNRRKSTDQRRLPSKLKRQEDREVEGALESKIKVEDRVNEAIEPTTLDLNPDALKMASNDSLDRSLHAKTPDDLTKTEVEDKPVESRRGRSKSKSESKQTEMLQSNSGGIKKDALKVEAVQTDEKQSDSKNSPATMKNLDKTNTTVPETSVSFSKNDQPTAVVPKVSESRRGRSKLKDELPLAVESNDFNKDLTPSNNLKKNSEEAVKVPEARREHSRSKESTKNVESTGSDEGVVITASGKENIKEVLATSVNKSSARTDNGLSESLEGADSNKDMISSKMIINKSLEEDKAVEVAEAPEAQQGSRFKDELFKTVKSNKVNAVEEVSKARVGDSKTKDDLANFIQEPCNEASLQQSNQVKASAEKTFEQRIGRSKAKDESQRDLNASEANSKQALPVVDKIPDPKVESPKNITGVSDATCTIGKPESKIPQTRGSSESPSSAKTSKSKNEILSIKIEKIDKISDSRKSRSKAKEESSNSQIKEASEKTNIEASRSSVKMVDNKCSESRTSRSKSKEASSKSSNAIKFKMDESTYMAQKSNDKISEGTRDGFKSKEESKFAINSKTRDVSASKIEESQKSHNKISKSKRGSDLPNGPSATIDNKIPERCSKSTSDEAASTLDNRKGQSKSSDPTPKDKSDDRSFESRRGRSRTARHTIEKPPSSSEKTSGSKTSHSKGQTSKSDESSKVSTMDQDKEVIVEEPRSTIHDKKEVQDVVEASKSARGRSKTDSTTEPRRGRSKTPKLMLDEVNRSSKGRKDDKDDKTSDENSSSRKRRNDKDTGVEDDKDRKKVKSDSSNKSAAELVGKRVRKENDKLTKEDTKHDVKKSDVKQKTENRETSKNSYKEEIRSRSGQEERTRDDKTSSKDKDRRSRSQERKSSKMDSDTRITEYKKSKSKTKHISDPGKDYKQTDEHNRSKRKIEQNDKNSKIIKNKTFPTAEEITEKTKDKPETSSVGESDRKSTSRKKREDVKSKTEEKSTRNYAHNKDKQSLNISAKGKAEATLEEKIKATEDVKTDERTRSKSDIDKVGKEKSQSSLIGPTAKNETKVQKPSIFKSEMKSKVSESVKLYLQESKSAKEASSNKSAVEIKPVEKSPEVKDKKTLPKEVTENSQEKPENLQKRKIVEKTVLDTTTGKAKESSIDTSLVIKNLPAEESLVMVVESIKERPNFIADETIVSNLAKISGVSEKVGESHPKEDNVRPTGELNLDISSTNQDFKSDDSSKHEGGKLEEVLQITPSASVDTKVIEIHAKTDDLGPLSTDKLIKSSNLDSRSNVISNQERGKSEEVLHITSSTCIEAKIVELYSKKDDLESTKSFDVDIPSTKQICKPEDKSKYESGITHEELHITPSACIKTTKVDTWTNQTNKTIGECDTGETLFQDFEISVSHQEEVNDSPVDSGNPLEEKASYVVEQIAKTSAPINHKRLEPSTSFKEPLALSKVSPRVPTKPKTLKVTAELETIQIQHKKVDPTTPNCVQQLAGSSTDKKFYIVLDNIMENVTKEASRKRRVSVEAISPIKKNVVIPPSELETGPPPLKITRRSSSTSDAEKKSVKVEYLPQNLDLQILDNISAHHVNQALDSPNDAFQDSRLFYTNPPAPVQPSVMDQQQFENAYGGALETFDFFEHENIVANSYSGNPDFDITFFQDNASVISSVLSTLTQANSLKSDAQTANGSESVAKKCDSERVSREQRMADTASAIESILSEVDTVFNSQGANYEQQVYTEASATNLQAQNNHINPSPQEPPKEPTVMQQTMDSMIGGCSLDATLDEPNLHDLFECDAIHAPGISNIKSVGVEDAVEISSTLDLGPGALDEPNHAFQALFCLHSSKLQDADLKSLDTIDEVVMRDAEAQLGAAGGDIEKLKPKQPPAKDQKPPKLDKRTLAFIQLKSSKKAEEVKKAPPMIIPTRTSSRSRPKPPPRKKTVQDPESVQKIVSVKPPDELLSVDEGKQKDNVQKHPEIIHVKVEDRVVVEPMVQHKPPEDPPKEEEPPMIVPQTMDSMIGGCSIEPNPDESNLQEYFRCHSEGMKAAAAGVVDDSNSSISGSLDGGLDEPNLQPLFYLEPDSSKHEAELHYADLKSLDIIDDVVIGDTEEAELNTSFDMSQLEEDPKEVDESLGVPLNDQIDARPLTEPKAFKPEKIAVQIQPPKKISEKDKPFGRTSARCKPRKVSPERSSVRVRPVHELYLQKPAASLRVPEEVNLPAESPVCDSADSKASSSKTTGQRRTRSQRSPPLREGTRQATKILNKALEISQTETEKKEEEEVPKRNTSLDPFDLLKTVPNQPLFESSQQPQQQQKEAKKTGKKRKRTKVSSSKELCDSDVGSWYPEDISKEKRTSKPKSEPYQLEFDESRTAYENEDIDWTHSDADPIKTQPKTDSKKCKSDPHEPGIKEDITYNNKHSGHKSKVYKAESQKCKSEPYQPGFDEARRSSNPKRNEQLHSSESGRESSKSHQSSEAETQGKWKEDQYGWLQKLPEIYFHRSGNTLSRDGTSLKSSSYGT